MVSIDPVKSEYPEENKNTTSTEPIVNAFLPPVACMKPIKSETDTISVKTPKQSNPIGITKCNFGMGHDNMKSIILMFKKKMAQSHDEMEKTIQRCKTTELELIEEQNQVRELQSKIDILEQKLKKKVEEISLLQRFHVRQANGQVFQVKLHPVRRVSKRLKVPAKHAESNASKSGVWRPF